MNTKKLVATAVTAAAFVGFIGLTYAQSTTDSGNAPGSAASASEPDSKYVAPPMDASTMPQPSTSSTPDSSTNAAPADSTGGSTSSSPNGSSSPATSAPTDSADPLTEKAARTDRN